VIHLGLLGKDISHSRSQEMYEGILARKIDYTLFDYSSEKDIPKVEKLFETVQGLSITAPYKKYYLETVVLSDEIKELGAINCIKKSKDEFFGTNTDFLAVKDLISDFSYDSIALLGNGSMASITKAVLKERNISFKQYFRQRDGDISELDLSSSKNVLVINSCSRSFLFKGKLSEDSTFWDYNYSSKEQEEVIRNIGINYVDGLSLLKKQAEHALKFWNISNT
jgi:shikimate dehydrogenase